MEIDARVTINVSSDSGENVEINIRDNNASITFCQIVMSPDVFLKAIGRYGNCECISCDIYGIEKLGKKLELSTHEFKIPENIDRTFEKDREKVVEYAKENCPEGWETDAYFNSHNSFFTKDGERWARTTLRRWI